MSDAEAESVLGHLKQAGLVKVEDVRRAKKERREHPGTGRAWDQQIPESKASEETCRTAAIEGCTQETQAGQPDCNANVAADDIRAAADIIVYGLGEELSRLLQVLGEHASITRQDLIAASARASRQKGLSEAHARAVTRTPGLPKDLDRMVPVNRRVGLGAVNIRDFARSMRADGRISSRVECA
jgi:hypothetical protein